MRGVGFAPDIAFSLMAKKLNFSLIWPENLFPYVWGVSYMPFGEHQTCLIIFFFKQWLYSGHFPWNPSLWIVRLKVVLWTDTPISGVELCSFFRVILVVFFPSLINALLAWSVNFGGQPPRGAIFFPFFNNGFNGAPWDVQSFWYFFITQPCPWPVWRAPWSAWWCYRLWGHSEQVYIYTEIMWHLNKVHPCAMWLLKVIGCTRSYLVAS